MRHQMSVFVPVSGAIPQANFWGNGTAGSNQSGLGDAVVNYRYGVRLDPLVAIAPRFSVVLPTGSTEKSGGPYGAGATGLQFAFPISWEVSPLVVTHANIGMGWTPDRSNTIHRRDLISQSLGGSVVLRVANSWNSLLEFVTTRSNSGDDPTRQTWSRESYLNPGIRFAFNMGGAQCVPGFSMPIGLGDPAETRGILLYFSVEGNFP